MDVVEAGPVPFVVLANGQQEAVRRVLESGWTMVRWPRQSGRMRDRAARNVRSDGLGRGRSAFRCRTSSR
jgi:hypothetical protein